MPEGSRRFPPPWRADKIPGGYVVRDANGQELAYVYSRTTLVEAMQAKVLTAHEARRIAVNNCEVAGAAWEERTCGLSSRARRNLHRFRAGTTAGREIGDRAKIPARDYARGSPISQPSSSEPSTRTIPTAVAINTP
jgi:hypothetical protein